MSTLAIIAICIVGFLLYSIITLVIARNSANYPDLEDYAFSAFIAMMAMMVLPFTLAVFTAWAMDKGLITIVTAREAKIRKLEKERTNARYREIEQAERIKELERELLND